MKANEIRRIPLNQCVARFYPGFKETRILNVLDRLAWKSPLILKGPKGAGKTLNLEQWAYTRRVPFLRKSCTADTSDRQLLGANTLKSFTESYFVLGALSAAIDLANEAGQCLLVLEEINALNEEAQKAVNSIADYRREVDLPHVGQVFRLAERILVPFDAVVEDVEELDAHRTNIVLFPAAGGTAVEMEVPTVLVRPNVVHKASLTAGQVLVEAPRLWVVGTMNPGYGGTYDLNEDFRSRFKFVEVSYMDDATEKEILHSKFPSKLVADEVLFVDDLRTMAKETRGGKLGYGLSTRDLEQVIEDFLSFKDRGMALKMLEGKFDAQYVPDYQARVKSTFKIDLTTVTLW